MKSSMTICVIDDDPIYQLITRKLIENLKLDMNILSFSDGKAAIEAFRKWEAEDHPFPDCILLDIEMPVMNGWDFMEEYRQFPPERKQGTRLYMVSSSIATEDIERARAYKDMKRYVYKPISPRLLSELLA